MLSTLCRVAILPSRTPILMKITAPRQALKNKFIAGSSVRYFETEAKLVGQDDRKFIRQGKDRISLKHRTLEPISGAPFQIGIVQRKQELVKVRVKRKGSHMQMVPIDQESNQNLNNILKNSESLYCSASPNRQEKSQPQSDKPNIDQLNHVSNVLEKTLKKVFTHSLDYSIYHQDIVLIDNIRHLRAQGLNKYIQQVALLKTVGHFKFAYVKLEILNMSTSQEDGRITVRWRLSGLSGLRVMLKFWQYRLWKWQEIMKQQETWHDGISYYDVGADGKIFQHIIDKVIEDKHREIDEKKSSSRNIPIAATLFKTK